LILEGAASALGIGLAEELFFRGWMLDELERDYQPQVALAADAGLFALLHFLKPIPVMIQSLPQFPGLCLFGTVMIVAKRQHGNLLGISIGLHAGMVWAYYIVNVGNMVKYSGRVSDWATGINGNPIAGFLGLLFLGILIILLPKISGKATDNKSFINHK
jgi:membrane protease YdiL (CAAX protease family)